VSRNGNTFKSFEGPALPKALRTRSAVLDGEIVCLDTGGRSNFSDLFYRRCEMLPLFQPMLLGRRAEAFTHPPVFVAFDLLSANESDTRSLPLVERKVELRRVIRRRASGILYTARLCFRLACEHDLEGIVAKHRSSPYLTGREDTTWFKIRNRSYSQWDGRDEMFQRPEEPMCSGWDLCAVAAAG
jgi:bifunctional non-homologous end joining protein LigD